MKTKNRKADGKDAVGAGISRRGFLTTGVVLAAGAGLALNLDKG